ncbi:MAG TPA: KpsF/GutQ family sugar-phosphate isomerase [Arcobacter sp.]|nr:KpsF/GutQ family sugar-phosphate isomerase [Arcobacter sp.]
MDILQLANETFEVQSNEIANLKNNITDDFEKAVNAVYNSTGKLIVSGMGKSGLLGTKIAATLASTGTPSFFMHPGEAYHGDLGMIEPDDVVLLLSNSGETDEVLKILPFLKSQGNVTISMSGNPKSTLANYTDYHLNISVSKEGCPIDLAPMASTTATLVMGDALASALMKLRDFKDRDFAQFHPGGSLGRRLLTKVENVMHEKDLPLCSADTDMKETIHTMSSSKFGMVIVMDNKNILGVVTDGDIRRAMENNQSEFFHLKVSDLMNKTPKTISKDSKLTDAGNLMNENKINSLIVADDGVLEGIVQIYDLGI